MKNIKKIIILCVMASMLTACGSTENDNMSSVEETSDTTADEESSADSSNDETTENSSETAESTDEEKDSTSDESIENNNDEAENDASTDSSVTTDTTNDSSEEDAMSNYKPITEEEYSSFSTTVEAQDVDMSKPDNYNSVTREALIGKTWYCPDYETAIRVYEQGIFVYADYDSDLDIDHGDVLYSWDLEDRSDRGLCPSLNIYDMGVDTSPSAWYISRITDDYFVCFAQGAVFYRQPD